MTAFTNEQLSAIETRDKTLLVSAAAGSGKTATLTERIIRSILDEENPIDISDMLIVTFTRAAARELSEKITKRVKSALSVDKDNERLKKQLVLLNSARISTIDSFCADVLKSNTEKFALSPRYRILDTAEANLLSIGIINAMIEECLSGKAPDVATRDEFEALAEVLVGVKGDDALAECLLSLHDKSKSALSGAKIFRELASLHEISTSEPIESNRYVEYSLFWVRAFSEHYTCAFEKLSKNLTGITASENAVISNIQKDLEVISRGKDVKAYADAKEFLLEKLPKKPPVKSSEATEGTDLYKTMRDSYKSGAEKLYKKLFSFSEQEWRETAKESSRIINILASFIEKFDEIYFNEKRKMAALEYSDVEKLAYLTLYDGDEPSETALAMREEFKAIYIDEYQDVSPIQNAIFDAISKPNNRFMVGDVKQSIYSFRSARPEIFVGMKKSFPELAKSEKSDAASIFMSKNFRCDEQIINFVNEIFDKCFEINKESIGYTVGDRLSYGKNEPCEKRRPEIHIFTSPDENGETDVLSNDISGELDESKLTPNFVCKKIKELVNGEKLNTGRGITYSDIAILFRHNDTVRKYKDALNEAGIPCQAVADREFFLNADVLLMLSLLNVIDNPRRDIYLAALMCSPLFSFTADELYKIKSKYDAGSLYASLISYNEKTHDEKSNYILSEIKRYRMLSEGVGVDSLISKLYSETGILYLAAKNHGKNNLMLLYNYAKNYEKNGYKGLYSFISYINSVIENKESFEISSTVEESDAVKIASVHASKGLEYPVVFLVEAQRSTGSVDRRARVSYKEDFGIGFKLRDPSGLALVSNPIQNSIILYGDSKNFEEELRVLYVALTRARERLYVVAKVRDDAYSFETKTDELRVALTPYSQGQLHSFLDVMLASLDKRYFFIHTDSACADNSDLEDFKNTAKEEQISCVPDFDELTKRFTFEYGYSYQTKIPEKLSISHLYPSILDEDDDLLTIDENVIAERDEALYLPRFISGKSNDESAKAGIATHTFMQFCDFSALRENGAKNELERLCNEGFISKENATRVRISEINTFINSNLFNELLLAKKLYRELRFNCELDAHLFTNDSEKAAAIRKEKMLIQGVIDCIIEKEDGSLHIIDYKTDRLKKEELANRSLAEKTLRDKHSLQLNYYKDAVEKMFSKKPKSVRVYSLHLGDCIEI
jgi:ATP-dependent helicase/nuclease subunit A